MRVKTHLLTGAAAIEAMTDGVGCGRADAAATLPA